MKPNCCGEVVQAQALNQTYWFCRGCKEEVKVPQGVIEIKGNISEEEIEKFRKAFYASIPLSPIPKPVFMTRVHGVWRTAKLGDRLWTACVMNGFKRFEEFNPDRHTEALGMIHGAVRNYPIGDLVYWGNKVSLKVETK